MWYFNKPWVFFPKCWWSFTYYIGIEPWTFVQKLGDAVLIPAGCPHQVRNIKVTSLIKILSLPKRYVDSVAWMLWARLNPFWLNLCNGTFYLFCQPFGKRWKGKYVRKWAEPSAAHELIAPKWVMFLNGSTFMKS